MQNLLSFVKCLSGVSCLWRCQWDLKMLRCSKISFLIRRSDLKCPILGTKWSILFMLLLQVMQIDTIHAATEMQFLPAMNVSQYWSGKLGLGSKPRSAMLVSTLSFGLSLDPSCLVKLIFTVPLCQDRLPNFYACHVVMLPWGLAAGIPCSSKLWAMNWHVKMLSFLKDL